MAKHDPADLTSVKQVSIPDYHASLTGDIKGLRIGLIRHFYTKDNLVSVTTCDAIDAAAKTLEGMGARVDEITLSTLSDWTACGGIIMLAEGYAIHEATLKTRFTDYGEVLRDRLTTSSLTLLSSC